MDSPADLLVGAGAISDGPGHVGVVGAALGRFHRHLLDARRVAQVVCRPEKQGLSAMKTTPENVEWTGLTNCESPVMQ